MIRKKKISKRILKERPRCNGLLTESAFWSFIRSALRNKSRWWKPISLTKLNARRSYKGINKRQKFEYLCNYCKQYFPDKMTNVDHIIPVGTLTCAADLPGFVERLFCEVSDLQVLCSECHNIKTKIENNGNSIKRTKCKNKEST